MRAFIACVDYADLFRVALHHNARYFDEIIVLTCPRDSETIHLCSLYSNVKVHITESFYQGGASFNRGLAYEEALDRFGRHDWICFLDADIVLPSDAVFNDLITSKLYGAKRIILWDVKDWKPDLHWVDMPAYELDGNGFPGYFQLFHGSAIADKRPWYPTKYKNVSIADIKFLDLYHPDNRLHLPFKVLHLGPDRVNWNGRVSERLK